MSVVASGIPTYSPGQPRPREGVSDRQRIAILGILLTIATTIVTYTVTVTMLYAEIRRDYALLQQTVDFNKRLADQEHMTLRQRIDQLQLQQDRTGR